MLVTALDARVRLGTHEDHRITFANMAFTDDPGVQRQAAAESAANIAKDLGIALERIGIKRSGRPTRYQVGPTTEPYVRISRIRLFEKSLITAESTPQVGDS